MPDERGKEFLQKFITPAEPTWRERQLARKAEREKEGIGGGIPQKRAAKTERRIGPDGGVQVYEKKALGPEIAMIDGDPENVAWNLPTPRTKSTFINQMYEKLNLARPFIDALVDDNYQGHDHPDFPPGEDDEHLYNR